MPYLTLKNYSFFNNLNSLYLLIKIWIIWNFSFNDLLLLLVEQFLSQLTYTVLIIFFCMRVLFYSASIMHKCNTTPYTNYVKLAVTMKGFRVLTCFYKISSLWHFWYCVKTHHLYWKYVWCYHISQSVHSCYIIKLNRWTTVICHILLSTKAWKILTTMIFPCLFSP